jgi:hypothetical protein
MTQKFPMELNSYVLYMALPSTYLPPCQDFNAAEWFLLYIQGASGKRGNLPFF